MRRRPLPLLLLVVAACGGDPAGPAVAEPAPLVLADPGPTALIALPAGAYAPLFPGRDGMKSQPVAAFQLEQHPVTNAQFLAFVAAEPRWRKSQVARLFADAGYLAAWRGDLDPGPDLASRPVTAVSWFAARAYARWRGRRLPTLAEWEYAAALPLRDGADTTRAVLAWYSRPGDQAPGPVGSGFAHANGVGDLHGLCWEHVDDFATAMVTGDARSSTDLQRSLFCGAGAIGAARPEDYAAFMRYALRSSLDGDATTRHLGFRCALDGVARERP